MSILKRFFISFLGSMAAIWMSSLLILILIVAGAAFSLVALGGSDRPGAVEVKKGSVLAIDLSGVIDERRSEASFKDVIYGQLSDAQSLNEITAAIYRAAHDSRIGGIYLECGGVQAGIASLQSINEALRYFHSQPDKWIMAYGDSYGQGDYYAASSAGEIWLNPQGAVDVHGLSSTTLFYTGLLDKLGVKMQVIKVGTFKSAVEPYILRQMSEPSRLQQQVYIGSLWQSVKGDIAENRGVKPEEIDQWADDFIFTRPAIDQQRLGVVTDIGYRHEAESRLAALAGKDDYEDVNLVDVSDYCAAIDLSDFSYLPDVKSSKRKDKEIAVLYAVGEISDSGKEGIVGEKMVDEIFDLIDDADNLAGLILRVNSPGGSAFASEQIWEALEQFKEETGLPFYVSMGDVAASGGYYISCGADRIYAQPTTLTGSIGIFGLIPQISGLLEEHLGVTTSTVQTNPNANFPTILEPMTPEQLGKMQAFVERGYDTFTRRVAQGRGISQDSVKAVAEGRVWDGSLALEKGLVDRLGSLRTAITDMASDLGLSSYKVVEYPSVKSKWWEEIMEIDGMGELKGAMPDAETFKLYQHLQDIKDAPRVQCRMETVLIK